MKSVQLSLISSVVFLCHSAFSHANEELLSAAFAGDINRVENLLPEISVNYLNADGFSALSKASISGHYEIAVLLLDRGADVESRTATGTTPLMFASAWSHKDIVGLLLENDARLNAQNQDGLTAFSLAAKHGRLDVIKVLVEAGSSATIFDNYGNGALLHAAAGGHLGVVRELLSLGADVEHKNNRSETPLIWASRYGRLPVVERLITDGANVDWQSDAGGTALMTAAAYGHAAVVGALLKNGADKELKTADGETARMLAEAQGHKEVLGEFSFDGIVLRRYGEAIVDDGSDVRIYDPEDQQQAMDAQNLTPELEKAAASYDSGDYTVALELYEDLAMHGSVQAQLELGRMYERGDGAMQDDAAAALWLGEAATSGLAAAQFELGTLYALEDSSVQDFAHATKWFREAAMQGHAEAQFNIGIAYEKGYSVAVDSEQALSWFLLAAEQEHDSAQFKLGVMYTDGLGTPKDEAAAFEWFRRAADNGNPGAQYNMGIFYAIGFRAEQDREQAKLWLEKSAAQGFDGAETTLAKLDELVVEARDTPQPDVAEIKTLVVQELITLLGIASSDSLAAFDQTDIKAIQQLLNELGHDAGTADGVAASKTRAAARAFKLQHRLLVETVAPVPGHGQFALVHGEFYAYLLGPDNPAVQIEAPRRGGCPVSYVYQNDAWHCSNKAACDSPVLPTLCDQTSQWVLASNLVHKTARSILSYGVKPGYLDW